MKRFLKPGHYLAVMRRQPAHVQHVISGLLAGGITLVIASLILYFDYGFWREKYSRSEALETVQGGDLNYSVVETKSPGAMFSDFMKEVSERLETIGTSSVDILDGKDTYKREP